MYIKIIKKGLILLPILILGAIPRISNAEESASFKLYHEAPQYGERGASESDSFMLNEDGVTWSAKPLTSNSFQIVTASPAAAAATPPPTTEEEEEEEEEGSGGGGGGHRGQGTTRPVPGVDPSEPPDDEEPDKPAAPVAGDEDKTDDAVVTDDPFSDIDFVPSDAKTIYDDGVGYPRGERRLAPLHYFYKTEPDRKVEYIVIKEEVLTHEAAQIIERSRTLQVTLMLTQAVSALCFLMAFQLLLSKVPLKFLKK